MCKWRQPFRVSDSHVKSSQCKINAFFYLNFLSYACMGFKVRGAMYGCCLHVQAQVHWVDPNWCITLSEVNWTCNGDTFIFCCCASLEFCLWLFYWQKKTVRFVCCLSFTRPHRLCIVYNKRKRGQVCKLSLFRVSSFQARETSGTQVHFELVWCARVKRYFPILHHTYRVHWQVAMKGNWAAHFIAYHMKWALGWEKLSVSV